MWLEAIGLCYQSRLSSTSWQEEEAAGVNDLLVFLTYLQIASMVYYQIA
jgi:hypothetical protein